MPATLLLQAYQSHQPLDASPETGPASVEQAYAAQQTVWREMVGERRPSVWKAGTPNRQTEPTAAAIFPHRIASSPAHFSADDFRTLGIEAEIAVRFGRDLPARAEPYRREEILAAIASAHVAMELIDSRLADPKAAGPLWRLADNLLNGGLIIGAEIPNWRELDFSGLSVRVHANGLCLAESVGRPPLDDLFYCLPWWIAHVGGAKAGDIVTTGAWNGMHPVSLPAEVNIEFLNRNNSLGLASARIG
ncbi:MAG: hydratase [Hydrogenophilales bacterium 28-61-23]|nr:MAG: hydratase [Hydrogenophilales bacterium 28-61-23]